MTREWQPGEVAMVSCEDGNCPSVEHPAIYSSVDKWWLLDSGEYSGRVRPLRPLVTLDPENREQVERLEFLYIDNATKGGTVADFLQAALREFVNPTPPKPTEPTDPAARVTDRFGDVWASHGGVWHCLTRSAGFPRTWDELCERGPLEIQP